MFLNFSEVTFIPGPIAGRALSKQGDLLMNNGVILLEARSLKSFGVVGVIGSPIDDLK